MPLARGRRVCSVDSSARRIFSLAQLTDNPSDTPLTLLPKLKKHSYDDIEKKQNLMRSAGEL